MFSGISKVMMAAALGFGLSLVSIQNSVHAHKGATGIVKERMSAMKSIADAMKALGAMASGRTPYDPAKTKIVAATIKQHADGIPQQFPKGSIKGPSEALPAIWKNWNEFKEEASKLARLADFLGGSASNGKADMAELLVKMGATCKSCHEGFRKKK